jgi:hypothetical protein
MGYNAEIADVEHVSHFWGLGSSKKIRQGRKFLKPLN